MLHKSLSYANEMSKRIELQQTIQDQPYLNDLITSFDTGNEKYTSYDWNNIAHKLQEDTKQTQFFSDPTTALSQSIDLTELEQGIQNYMSSLIISSDSYVSEDPLLLHFISNMRHSLNHSQTQFGDDARTVGLIQLPTNDSPSTSSEKSDDCVLNFFWNKLSPDPSLEVCCFHFSPLHELLRSQKATLSSPIIVNFDSYSLTTMFLAAQLLCWIC